MQLILFAFWMDNSSIGLIYIPLSVNITRDISKDYDDMKNNLDFLAFRHNVKAMTQKSSAVGTKIKFVWSNRVNSTANRFQSPDSDEADSNSALLR